MDEPIQAKKVFRTYSRLDKRRRSATEHVSDTKRRRIEEDIRAEPPKPAPFSTLKAWLKSSSPCPSLTSTPDDRSDDTPILSDSALSCVTPPSSPPPLLDEITNSDASEREPLAPTTGNLTRAAKSQLVQMQINLGSNLQKTCKDCGMTYVKSNAEDSILHDKFHARYLNGLDLGKPFRKFAASRIVWQGQGDALVVIVDAKDRVFERRKVREVLEVVQAELGAVEIPDHDLWSIIGEAEANQPETRSNTAADSPGPSQSRYRAFLYLEGVRCTGLCLAKSISAGRKVNPSASPDDGISVDNTCSGAEVGISRIWTSKCHRQKGIAGTLLDAVARSFHSGRSTSKDQIAFSQPTTAGASLARRWFGQQYGWLVYLD